MTAEEHSEATAVLLQLLRVSAPFPVEMMLLREEKRPCLGHLRFLQEKQHFMLSTQSSMGMPREGIYKNNTEYPFQQKANKHSNCHQAHYTDLAPKNCHICLSS